MICKQLKTHLKAKYFFIFILALACDDGEHFSLSQCDRYSYIATSPYSDPIWHPSGRLIAFNHLPVKEIIPNKDCPDEPQLLYDFDKSGFYLMHADGSNVRRLFSKQLHSPVWSPDGTWIAYVDQAQIFKIPFDGVNLDTSSITQITHAGTNFHPAWSPSGNLIAFRNSDCGAIFQGPPPNSCGVVLINADGSGKKFISGGSEPYWSSTDTLLYTGGTEIDLNTLTQKILFDYTELHIKYYKKSKFDPTGKYIGFIGIPESGGHEKLFVFELATLSLRKISYESISDFSWAPDGRLVYLNYDNRTVNKTKSTLWIMNVDGSQKHQLTFNP